MFSSCDPLTKTRLLQSFCLSLYGAALWNSSRELPSLEIAFNNILRKIWKLPHRCHTGILHQVANLPSIYNVVLRRSQKLMSSALKSPSQILVQIFSDCHSFAVTSLGYNNLYGYRHLKSYNEADRLCANFIREARLSPSPDNLIDNEVIFMCTV